MAIATYNDLLTLVQNYEDDATSVVTGVIADLVTLAEQRIFYGFGAVGDPMYSPPLRVRSMEKSQVFPIGPGLDGGTSGGSANVQTLTMTAPTIARGLLLTFTAGFSNTGAMTLQPTGGSAVDVRKGASRDALEAGDILVDGVYTVYHDGTYYVLMPSDGAMPLPSRFLGIKSAYIQDRDQILSPGTVSGINLYMEGATSDVPCYYAVDGDALRFDPLPADDYKLNLTYYAKPPALSSALNDVFRNAPSIYLFGTLLELALYLPNETAIERHIGSFKSALNAYQSADRMATTGHAPMRVRMGLAP